MEHVLHMFSAAPLSPHEAMSGVNRTGLTSSPHTHTYTRIHTRCGVQINLHFRGEEATLSKNQTRPSWLAGSDPEESSEEPSESSPVAYVRWRIIFAAFGFDTNSNLDFN